MRSASHSSCFVSGEHSNLLLSIQGLNAGSLVTLVILQFLGMVAVPGCETKGGFEEFTPAPLGKE